MGCTKTTGGGVMNDFLYINQQPTWALKNIIKALSIMSLLNTEQENKRLELAKQELNKRLSTKGVA